MKLCFIFYDFKKALFHFSLPFHSLLKLCFMKIKIKIFLLPQTSIWPLLAIGAEEKDHRFRLSLIIIRHSVLNTPKTLFDTG